MPLVTAFSTFVSWLLSAVTALMLMIAAPLAQADGTETVQQTLQWNAGANGHVLEVSDISGSVRITAYDGSAVELVARRIGHSRRGITAAEALARVRMDVRSDAAGIRICADSQHCGCRLEDRGWRRDDRDRPEVEVDFELRVPRDTTLLACTINGSEMAVDGLAGDFDVSNVNGAVHLTNMRGSGSAITVNGEVTASFLENPSANSTFKTVNGNIDVRFPPDLAADLRLKTMNGGLYTDFDVTTRPATITSTNERRNGRFVYRSNAFATVRVAGGGPELTFEGLNSRIRVLKND